MSPVAVTDVEPSAFPLPSTSVAVVVAGPHATSNPYQVPAERLAVNDPFPPELCPRSVTVHWLPDDPFDAPTE